MLEALCMYCQLLSWGAGPTSTVLLGWWVVYMYLVNFPIWYNSSRADTPLCWDRVRLSFWQSHHSVYGCVLVLVLSRNLERHAMLEAWLVSYARVLWTCTTSESSIQSMMLCMDASTLVVLLKSFYTSMGLRIMHGFPTIWVFCIQFSNIRMPSKEVKRVFVGVWTGCHQQWRSLWLGEKGVLILLQAWLIGVCADAPDSERLAESSKLECIQIRFVCQKLG